MFYLLTNLPETFVWRQKKVPKMTSFDLFIANQRVAEVTWLGAVGDITSLWVMLW